MQAYFEPEQAFSISMPQPAFEISIAYIKKNIYWGRSAAHIYFVAHLYIHELPMKYSREKNLDNEILTIKNFGPTKYPREKISNPRNTNDKII